MLVASTSLADSGRTLQGTDATVNRSFAWERTFEEERRHELRHDTGRCACRVLV